MTKTFINVVERSALLAKAAALDWPRCQYGVVIIEGETAWRGAAMPLAIDRRELSEQLDAFERARGEK